MGMHPNVQAKAQAELDAWLGTGDDARLPTFADRPQLPYLEHVLWEVCASYITPLQWLTVVPSP
jgi:Cytochrome P450